MPPSSVQIAPPSPSAPRFLLGIEAERGRVTQAAGARATVGGAVRLGGVLEQQQAVTLCECSQGFDRAYLPVQVDRQDGGRRGTDRRLRRLEVDEAAATLHVDVHRCRSGMLYGTCTRYERVRGDDHLVATSDACRLQHDGQRRGAGGDAHAVAHPAIRGKLGLELLDLLTKDECARPQHAVECGPQLFGDGCVLTGKVNKWHRRHAFSYLTSVVLRAAPDPRRGEYAKPWPVRWKAEMKKVHELDAGPRHQDPALTPYPTGK